MMTETVVTVQDTNAANKHQDNAAQGGNANSLSWIQINVDYFKTLPGLLKIAQVILGIICMSLASPAYVGATHWFLFVATSSFIITLIWIFIYFLSVREALRLPINWILTEFLNTAIITLLYVIAFLVQLIAWVGLNYTVRGSNIAAGVFGIFNAIAYGAGAHFLYLEYKNSISNA